MQSAHGNWSAFAVAREEEDRFAVYSVLDVVVPRERLAEACELLTRANWGLAVGNWELDMDDGTLRCKTSIDVSGDRLSPALAARTIERNLEVTEAYCAHRVRRRPHDRGGCAGARRGMSCGRARTRPGTRARV